MSVRVLVVDDHAAMRQSLTRVLESESDVQVVGEAADGGAAVRLAEYLHPDVIIMDVVLPAIRATHASPLHGIDATRRILQNHPKMIVIALSVHDCAIYAVRMLRAGARAYVLKEGGAEELVRAIWAARHGRTYLSPGIEGLDQSTSDASVAPARQSRPAGEGASLDAGGLSTGGTSKS